MLTFSPHDAFATMMITFVFAVILSIYISVSNIHPTHADIGPLMVAANFAFAATIVALLVLVIFVMSKQKSPLRTM